MVGFSDCISDTYCIPSVPESVNAQCGVDANAQTEKIKLRSMRIQATPFLSSECQTLTPEELHPVNLEMQDGWLVNPDIALDFSALPSVAIMEQELQQGSLLAAAFDSYQPVLDHERNLDVVLVETFSAGNLPTAALCWNITGSIVAASFGNIYTCGWSEAPESGEVHVWRCFRDKHELKVTPPSNSLVLCLAFHPIKPSLLAGGSYNGEVTLWDVSSPQDPQLASSDIGEYLHRDAVHAMEWQVNRLITLGADGKLLFWDIELNFQYPSRGFLVCSKKVDAFAGRALSVSSRDDNAMFCVGSETGLIYKGVHPPRTTTGQQIANWRPCALKVLDEIGIQRYKIQTHVEAYASRIGVKEITAETLFNSKLDPSLLFPPAKITELEPHQGPVQMLSFSPFHRKLMLSCSFDGSLRLFDVTSPRPMYVWYPYSHGVSIPISSVSWSHSRPLVFACCSEKSTQVNIYDLVDKKREPSLVIDLPHAARGAIRVAFNPVQHGVLAIGDYTGRLYLYRLPSSLTETGAEEGKRLHRMLAK
eukprot:GEMP01041141.1.p1 GENE.GEMP01041141.1~~GEMP01041141.1.p1  ORF type:complete len:534 (+),score=85.36 GEMP01041141.1:169-1770(+)